MAASTDDSDAFSPSATCHLSEKGKFATWKSEVELLAYSKGMGDVGAHLFEEDGGDVSYDAQSAVIKKKWMSTMKKLYGVVGATIKIDEVKQAWTQAWDDHFHDEEDSPYALYYCMKAAEELCIKHDQISKDIKTDRLGPGPPGVILTRSCLCCCICREIPFSQCLASAWNNSLLMEFLIL